MITRTAARLIFALIGILILASCSSAPKEPKEAYTKRRQADALITQGNQRMDSMLYEQAGQAYDAALKIYASLDYRPGTIRALLAMGRQRRIIDDPGKAAELYSHAQSMAGKLGDSRLLGDVLNHRADLALRSGNAVEALSLLEEGVSVPDGREAAARLRLQGSAEYSLGRTENAVVLLENAVFLAESADENVEAAQSYYKLASIASLDARFDDALRYAALALERDKAAEYAPGIAADLRALAIISAKAGRNDEAEDYYRRSWLAWRALGREADAESSRLELEALVNKDVGRL